MILLRNRAQNFYFGVLAFVVAILVAGCSSSGGTGTIARMAPPTPNPTPTSSPSASPAPSVSPSAAVTAFTLPSSTNSGPYGITVGPDGNLWFTESRAHQIGRITPAGVVTEFPLLSQSLSPTAIVAASDGALWFVFSGNDVGQPAVGRMTTTGAFSSFSVAAGTVYGIANGPDGNLWLAVESDSNVSSFVRMSTAGEQTVYTETNPGPGGGPFATNRIAAGPDGNMWITRDPQTIAGTDGQLASINPMTGVITEHPLPANVDPIEILTDPRDGQLWFTSVTASDATIPLRITTSGAVTQDPNPTVLSGGSPLAVGPDGNMWSANWDTGQLIDFSETFSTTAYQGVSAANVAMHAGAIPGMVTGPDGNVWFTELSANTIGRLNVAGTLARDRRPQSVVSPRRPPLPTHPRR